VNGVNHKPVQSSPRRQGNGVRFPYGKLSGWVILLVVGVLFVYRLSETGGKSSQAACLSAMVISFLAAFAGLIPIYKSWGKDLFWVLMGVFLSSTIRLLIGFLGAVIIFLFADIQRIQFIGFLALFYAALLAIDTWLALWILRNTEVDNDENQGTVIHGNIWDIISRPRKPA
jgi:hypothetical protein